MYMFFNGPEFLERIRLEEAKIFTMFALGVLTQTRPEDTESNIRGRLKMKLMAYHHKRRLGRWDGDQLKDILYQLWLYRAVVPGSFEGQILSFTDLRNAILTLPGKTLFWQDREEFERLCEAA